MKIPTQRVDEEILLALPLTKEPSVVPLPMSAVLKLQPCINPDYIQVRNLHNEYPKITLFKGMKEVARLVEKAVSQMAELADRYMSYSDSYQYVEHCYYSPIKIVTIHVRRITNYGTALLFQKTLSNKSFVKYISKPAL